MKKMVFVVGVLLIMLTSCDKPDWLEKFKIGKENQEKELTLQEKINAKNAELADMGELGTVEYNVTKVVKASDDAEWYKFGDRKILFNCTAILKAGIDMTKYDPSKIKISEAEKSIVVVLPKAELLSFNMPPEGAKLVYEKVDVTRFHFSAQERNLLLQQGEKAILADVPNMGILKEAENNATIFFKSLLTRMGFTSITVKFE